MTELCEIGSPAAGSIGPTEEESNEWSSWATNGGARPWSTAWTKPIWWWELAVDGLVGLPFAEARPRGKEEWEEAQAISPKLQSMAPDGEERPKSIKKGKLFQ